MDYRANAPDGDKERYVMRAPTMPRIGFSLARSKSFVKVKGMLRRQGSTSQGSESTNTIVAHQFDDASCNGDPDVAPVVDIEEFDPARNTPSASAQNDSDGRTPLAGDEGERNNKGDNLDMKGSLNHPTALETTSETSEGSEVKKLVSDGNTSQSDQKEQILSERGHLVASQFPEHPPSGSIHCSHQVQASRSCFDESRISQDSIRAPIQLQEVTEELEDGGELSQGLSSQDKEGRLQVENPQIGPSAPEDVHQKPLAKTFLREAPATLLRRLEFLSIKVGIVFAFFANFFLSSVRALSRGVRNMPFRIGAAKAQKTAPQRNTANVDDTTDASPVISRTCSSKLVGVSEATRSADNYSDSAFNKEQYAAGLAETESQRQGKEEIFGATDVPNTVDEFCERTGDDSRSTEDTNETDEDTEYGKILLALTSPSGDHNHDGEVGQNHLPKHSKERQCQQNTPAAASTVPKHSISKQFHRISSKLSTTISRDDDWTQIPSRQEVAVMKEQVPRPPNEDEMIALASTGGSHIGSVEQNKSLSITKAGSERPDEPGGLGTDTLGGDTRMASIVLKDHAPVSTEQHAQSKDTVPSPEMGISPLSCEEVMKFGEEQGGSRGQESMTHTSSSKSSSSCKKSDQSGLSVVSDPDRPAKVTDLGREGYAGHETIGKYSNQQIDMRSEYTASKISPALKAAKFPGRQNSNALRDIKNDAKSMLKALVPRKGGEDMRFTSPRSARKTTVVLADILANEMGATCSVRKNVALRMSIAKDFNDQCRMRLRMQLDPLDDFSCNVIFSKERGDKSDRGVCLAFVNDAHKKFIGKTSVDRNPQFSS